MEKILESFPTDLMLFGAFALTFGLELVRFWTLYALKLNLVWSGGWRYAYYLPYLALCAGLGSGVATFVLWLIHSIWLFCMRNIYLSSIFLVLLALVVFALFSTAFNKVWPKDKARRWATILTLVDLALFIWKGTRASFGGTLLLLSTSALGQVVSFTGWDDLVKWVSGKAPTAGEASSADRVRVQFFIEVAGILKRGANGVEVQGEIVDGTPEAQEETLAQKLLERIRMATLVESFDQLRNPSQAVAPQALSIRPAAPSAGSMAIERGEELTAPLPALEDSSYPMLPAQVAGAVEAVNTLQQGLDFQEELATLIAENVGKLYERRKSISQSSAPLATKEELFRKEIRDLLERRLGKKLRSLLYWHYDLPAQGVRLSVVRAPEVAMKPMLSLGEYLGLFVSWLGYGK